MTDIATISAFITSIKAATDMAKAIKETEFSLEKAETKLKMAELIEALADAKMHAAEIRDVIHEKDRIIVELEQTLNTRKQMSYKPPFYYMEGDAIPFCPKCWEVNRQGCHLLDHGHYYDCLNCIFSYQKEDLQSRFNLRDRCT
jgi:hypothetical protein